MSTPKKRSMFKRLFSKKSFEDDDDDEKEQKSTHKPQNSTTRCTNKASTSEKKPFTEASTSGKSAKAPLFDQSIASAPVGLKKKPPNRSLEIPVDDRTRKISTAKKKKCRKESSVKVDVHKPLEFPCTPELILEYHKRKAFLSPNEEWLLVELNEYECLVDNEDMIKVIAKHSKFFEVDPDELWEEFFEFVEELSCYDEVINNDIWQEFRDKKYLC